MSTTIAGYDYPPPSRADFQSTLSRVLGAEEADRAWAHACDVARLPAARPDPTVEDLTAVAQALIQMGELRSVVGNSMFVRLLTYQTLAKRGAGPGAGRPS